MTALNYFMLSALYSCSLLSAKGNESIKITNAKLWATATDSAFWEGLMAAKSIRVTIVVETKRKVIELSVVGAFAFPNACYGRRADRSDVTKKHCRLICGKHFRIILEDYEFRSPLIHFYIFKGLHSCSNRNCSKIFLSSSAVFINAKSDGA